MVLSRADCAAVSKADIAGQIARRQVFLAERGKTIKLFDVFNRELRKIDHGVDLDERMEAVLGKLVHICAQSLGELRKLIGRKGYSNRSSVPPETRENVRCGFDGLEQVHLADASTRPACFAVLYGEEQRRNAERIDQSGRDDALTPSCHPSPATTSARWPS